MLRGLGKHCRQSCPVHVSLSKLRQKAKQGRMSCGVDVGAKLVHHIPRPSIISQHATYPEQSPSCRVLESIRLAVLKLKCIQRLF